MPLFRRKPKLKQEHKIMQQAEQAAGALLPEYHRATAECPHPERWSMYDSMTAEYEVLEFLRTLVTTLKPDLVVETGSFLGVSTQWIAEGLERNGFGRVVSCEYDPVVFAKAQEKIAASPLRSRIELRNESSLEMDVHGTIDLLFSDSDMPDARAGSDALPAADESAWAHPDARCELASESGARSGSQPGAQGPALRTAVAHAARTGHGATEAALRPKASAPCASPPASARWRRRSPR